MQGELGCARNRITRRLKVGLDACSRGRHRKGLDNRLLIGLTSLFRISIGYFLCSGASVPAGAMVGRRKCVLGGGRVTLLAVCEGLSGGGRGRVFAFSCGLFGRGRRSTSGWFYVYLFVVFLGFKRFSVVFLVCLWCGLVASVGEGIVFG